MTIKGLISSKYLKIEKCIHPHRLYEYMGRGNHSNIKTLRRYRYNIELSSSIYASFSVLEVSLRNQITASWNEYFKRNYNSLFRGNLTEWPMDSRGVHYFMALKGYSPYDKKFERHLGGVEREKWKLQKNIDWVNRQLVSQGAPLKTMRNGDVVASLTFGFWRNCFENKYNDINRWAIRKIFPNRNFNNTNIIRDLRDISEDMKKLNELRNRFSHQEKIFHYVDLNVHYERIEKYIKFINPELLYLFDQNKFKKLWAKRSKYF